MLPYHQQYQWLQPIKMVQVYLICQCWKLCILGISLQSTYKCNSSRDLLYITAITFTIKIICLLYALLMNQTEKDVILQYVYKSH